MNSFVMNGYRWQLIFVHPRSDLLIDRTGLARVATTDPRSLCVYISDELRGEFLNRVVIHELGHCALFSFGLIDDVHRMVNEHYWIEAEEWVCNFIAEYGRLIFSIAGQLDLIPQELERFIS